MLGESSGQEMLFYHQVALASWMISLFCDNPTVEKVFAFGDGIHAAKQIAEQFGVHNRQSQRESGHSHRTSSKQ